MHVPKDAGTWALILSVLALILIYPVGVIVNLTTPRIQNWWALRSLVSLENRVVKLRRRIQEAEKLSLMTPFETLLMGCVRAFEYVALSLLALFLTVMLLVETGNHDAIKAHLRFGMRLLLAGYLLFSMLLSFVSLTWMHYSLNSFRSKHTQKGRDYVKAELYLLELALTKRKLDKP